MLTTCNEVSPTFSSSRTPPLPPAPRPRPHPTNHPSTRYLFIPVKWSLALSRFCCCCCCSKNQALRRRTAGCRAVRQRRRYSEAHVQHNASGAAAAAAAAGAKVRYLFGGILPCVSISVETSAYSSRCLQWRLNLGPSVYSDFLPSAFFC